MKSYLLPFLDNERGIELKLIKKCNQFVYFKFRDVQLLYLLNYLRGTRSFDFSLKTYKTSETKNYPLYEWFNDPEKLNIT